ncbi:MAG: hypothetical protein JRH06_17565, partial [Deltaproteobacteria bacterium]|nr:hypothetical protein [Deltaproteobacteria bacterium]
MITLKGIDHAISNLRFRQKTSLKSRLVAAIREFYDGERTLESLRVISSNTLIKLLWNTGDDPAAIRAKRKNLSSLKSAINAELKILYKEGKNPEGIIIGKNN